RFQQRIFRPSGAVHLACRVPGLTPGATLFRPSGTSPEGNRLIRLSILIIVVLSSFLYLGSAQQDSLITQTSEDAARKSAGCTSSGCHINTEPMHASPSVKLGCTDCHG